MFNTPQKKSPMPREVMEGEWETSPPLQLAHSAPNRAIWRPFPLSYLPQVWKYFEFSPDLFSWRVTQLLLEIRFLPFVRAGPQNAPTLVFPFLLDVLTRENEKLLVWALCNYSCRPNQYISSLEKGQKNSRKKATNCVDIEMHLKSPSFLCHGRPLNFPSRRVQIISWQPQNTVPFYGKTPSSIMFFPRRGMDFNFLPPSCPQVPLCPRGGSWRFPEQSYWCCSYQDKGSWRKKLRTRPKSTSKSATRRSRALLNRPPPQQNHTPRNSDPGWVEGMQKFVDKKTREHKLDE